MKLNIATIKAGDKVIHKTFRHWKVGEVTEVLSQTFSNGTKRVLCIRVKFHHMAEPLLFCLSDLMGVMCFDLVGMLSGRSGE